MLEIFVRVLVGVVIGVIALIAIAIAFGADLANVGVARRRRFHA